MNEDKDKDCLDPENKSKCCFFKVANAFLLLAVFLQSVILFFYAPRVINGESLGFDYIGVIIGILTLLVTLLVAWNIWQTIDSKNEIQRAMIETAKANRVADRCRHDIKMLRVQHLGFIKHMQGEIEFLDGRYYDASLSFINAARDYLTAQYNVETFIGICVDKIDMCLANAKKENKVQSGSQIKDLIDRIDKLDALLDNTSSAQKMNKQSISKIKSKLEEMLK